MSEEASFPRPGTEEYRRHVTQLAFDMSESCSGTHSMEELADAVAVMFFTMAMKIHIDPEIMSDRVAMQIAHLRSASARKEGP